MKLKKEPNSGILEAKVGLDGHLVEMGFQEPKGLFCNRPGSWSK